MIPLSLLIIMCASSAQVESRLRHDPLLQTQQQREPHPYPKAFQMHFHTNLTTSSADEGIPVRGKISYDWTIQSQRVDHSRGAYECRHFYNVTDRPCTLIFNERGMYRLIEDDEIPCCLDLPNIGPSPPDWASSGGTYDGYIYDAVSDEYGYQWTFKQEHSFNSFNSFRDREENTYHTYREVARGEYEGRPLTFSFPGESKGHQDYHFDFKSMVIGAQDPAIFALSEGCSDLLCEPEPTI